MAFFHVGGASTQPTFFEVYAADKLVPSLKSAISYSLSVLGQQRAWPRKLLEWENEVLALCCLAWDSQSLANHSGTFAESLYGMRREAVANGALDGGKPAAAAVPAAAEAALGTPAPAPGAPPHLSPAQRRAALVAEVLIPYLHAKGEQLYARASQRSVLGLAFTRATALHTTPDAREPGWRRLLASLQRGALAAFVAAFPFVHAALEGWRLAYQLLFLLGASPYPSPWMHLLRQRLVRVTGQETAAAARATASARQAQVAAARSTRWAPAGAARAAWVHASHFAADYARSGLILALFGFKLLEWWYNSAEERLAAGQALAPPPPPKAPLPDPVGCGLPADPALCPLCRCKRANPALVATSGYVFCYPCVFNHVSEQGCCPVTRFPATLDHIRKLYEAA